MSYILEALKKSQRERELGQVPDVHSEPEPTVTQSRSAHLFIGLILAIVIAITATIIAVYSLYFHASPESAGIPQLVSTPVSPPHPAVQPRHTNALPQPLTTVAARPAQTPVIEKHPTKKSLPVSVEKSPSVPGNSARKTAQTLSKPLPKPVAAAIPAPQAKKPRSPHAQTLASQQPPPAKRKMQHEIIASVPAAAVQPAAAQYPGLNALPTELRQELPPLKILLYYYTEQHAERFVILDSQKLYQGQTSNSGIKVHEIRQRGLVLEFQHQRFFKPR